MSLYHLPSELRWIIVSSISQLKKDEKDDKHVGSEISHLTWKLSTELLTVWEVEVCSSPASCSSCASMWPESRCSCTSSWEVQTREQRGQLNASLLWLTCWLLMCSCISSSPPNTAGQKGQCTADAAEPGGQTVMSANEALWSFNHSFILP